MLPEIFIMIHKSKGFLEEDYAKNNQLVDGKGLLPEQVFLRSAAKPDRRSIFMGFGNLPLGLALHLTFASWSIVGVVWMPSEMMKLRIWMLMDGKSVYSLVLAPKDRTARKSSGLSSICWRRASLRFVTSFLYGMTSFG